MPYIIFKYDYCLYVYMSVLADRLYIWDLSIIMTILCVYNWVRHSYYIAYYILLPLYLYYGITYTILICLILCLYTITASMFIFMCSQIDSTFETYWIDILFDDELATLVARPSSRIMLALWFLVFLILTLYDAFIL